MQMMKAVSPEEIKILCNIAAEVWHETYDPILPAGQTDYMVEKFQSVDAVTEQINTGGYHYYLFQDENGVYGGFVGFVPGHKQADEMFLSKVYILSSQRGKGIMRQALDTVIAETKKRNMKRIWLTVNKDNTHAQDVYAHYGFQICESLVSDIGGGYVMDDYVMEYLL